MSLTLKQVFDKVNSQEDPSVGYVYDAPIHYVVLNNEDNPVNMTSLNKMIAAYEKVEQSKDHGVLITIGTSEKFFSTGMDLNYWMENPTLNPMTSGVRLQHLFQKILSFEMPSMAIINGHAYGAGCVISLAHDFRIMK